MATTAVIVDAVRTAGGKRNGKLSGWHPTDLAAEVLKALQERNNLDPALIDDVIMGCVMQVGNQGLNMGRNARQNRLCVQDARETSLSAELSDPH